MGFKKELTTASKSLTYDLSVSTNSVIINSFLLFDFLFSSVNSLICFSCFKSVAEFCGAEDEVEFGLLRLELLDVLVDPAAITEELIEGASLLSRLRTVHKLVQVARPLIELNRIR